MTPHGVLEDMGQFERLAPVNMARVDMERWNMATEALKDESFARFDFSQAMPTDEHIDFGIEMLRMGAFRLPYGTVVLCFENELVVAQEDAAEDRLNGLRIIYYMRLNTREGRAFALPILIANLFFPANGKNVIGRISQDEWLGAMPNGDELSPNGLNRYQSQTSWCLDQILGASCMLKSKGVVTQVVEAPENLNKSRIAKGKPRIATFVKVKIDRHVATSEGGKSDRKSPKMHWRRGHFREISGGRVIPVSPALVSAAHDGWAAPKPYFVTH